MKDETARAMAIEAVQAMESFKDEVTTLVAEQVAKQTEPLAGALDSIRSAQSGAANAVRGQIESLYRELAKVSDALAGVTTQVEAACQDANAAKVDVGAVLDVVQDVQERLVTQRQSIVQFLEALNK